MPTHTFADRGAMLGKVKAAEFDALLKKYTEIKPATRAVFVAAWTKQSKVGASERRSCCS